MKKLLVIVTSMFCLTLSAQTISEVRAEMIRQGLPHHDIVLAQARLESGNFKSQRAKRDKNILGIKHGKKYAVYKRWQDCIADYKKRISSRYHGGDYFAFLKKIGYAKDPKYIQKVRNIVNGR